MEKYAVFTDIHNETYCYYKKSEIDLAFKNLEIGQAATLRQYNALNDEVSFEKEYSNDRYFRRFKAVEWVNLEDMKESVKAALEMREQLENGDFD